MPNDLLQLTTAFTGAQLIAVVYVLMSLQSIKEEAREKAKADIARDIEIGKIGKHLSRVMGRLDVKEDD